MSLFKYVCRQWNVGKYKSYTYYILHLHLYLFPSGRIMGDFSFYSHFLSFYNENTLFLQ